MITESEALQIGIRYAVSVYGSAIEPVLVSHLSESACGWTYVFTSVLGVSQQKEKNPTTPWYEDREGSSYPIFISCCTGEIASKHEELFPNRESFERYCCSLLPEQCLREPYDSLLNQANAAVTFEPALILLPSTWTLYPDVLATSPRIEQLRLDNRVPFSARFGKPFMDGQFLDAVELDIFDFSHGDFGTNLFHIEKIDQTITQDTVHVQYNIVGNFEEIFSRQLSFERQVRIKKDILPDTTLYGEFFLTIRVLPSSVWPRFWCTASEQG